MAGGTGQLTAAPLHPGDYGSFNWVFLIEYILCGILCLWFLFYFNRIFATLISYLVRLLTWHVFGVYVDIEALQVSILAGRVFFKGIRYHGDNETIFIHGGYVTWRYWLRKVKPCRLFQAKDRRSRQSKDYKLPSGQTATGGDVDIAEEGVLRESDSKLPCRIEIRVSGVEAYIYNRAPAYDYILETCAKHGSSADATRKETQFTVHAEKTQDTTSPRSKSDTLDVSSPSSDSLDSEPKQRRIPTVEDPKKQHRSGNIKYKPPSPPALLRLFPISVHCNKAAAVLGNENTPAILTAKIDSASGEFDASESGPLDVFKILMGFSVNKPFIQMKPNVDYKRAQLAEAALLESGDTQANISTGKRSARNNETRKAGKHKGRKSQLRNIPGLSRKAMESLESVAMMASSASQRKPSKP